MRTTIAVLAVAVLVGCGRDEPTSEPTYVLSGEWAVYAANDVGDPAHGIPAAVLGDLYFTDAGGGHAEMGPDYGVGVVWQAGAVKFDGFHPDLAATYSDRTGMEHSLTATFVDKSEFYGMLDNRAIRASFFSDDQE